MELNDVYDKGRNLTGRVHRRGDPWKDGEYGMVVCVWVYDGEGKLLLTRRAPEKVFGGTWENSGGAAKTGETSLQAIVRELSEETGICKNEEDFEYLGTTYDTHLFFDHYCVKAKVPLEQIVLQPGETDGAKWVTFDEVHEIIARGEMCDIIAQEFLSMEPQLRMRQNA